MRGRTIAIALLAAVSAGLAMPVAAEAQIGARLRRAAKNTVEAEAARRVTLLLRNAMRCVFDDEQCIDAARRGGRDVVLTDDGGNVLMDGDGEPITDPADVRTPPTKPGEGAWANYDFVPGDSVLFDEDFGADDVGAFPRRLTLVSGNWEVVEWQGRRLLRNTGPRGSAIEIPLQRVLPERFAIELEVHFPNKGQRIILAMATPPGREIGAIDGNYFQIGASPGTGVTANSREGVRATNPTEEVAERLVPIRIMVDGRYARVYANERRVANVPNAVILRSDRLYLETPYVVDADNPMLFGPIRVSAFGSDLYDVLERDGRVATRGIQFATGSARIRPESTPTLREIGALLRDHPDLRLSIEGHTDAVGDDASNQALSEERAAAVRAYLVETVGIDGARLRSAGFGESRPADSNDTPEGRQQNRRVELVRIE